MRKASAVKSKFGYKAVIIREDGSTLRATKNYANRQEAIDAAQKWIESIEENSKSFQEPKKPWIWENK